MSRLSALLTHKSRSEASTTPAARRGEGRSGTACPRHSPQLFTGPFIKLEDASGRYRAVFREYTSESKMPRLNFDSRTLPPRA